MRSHRLPWLFVLAAACSAPAPAPPLPHAARKVVTVARWRVTVDGEAAGRVLLLEIQDPSGPLRYYRVEDEQGRWLGHATAQGRFTRRVPFRDDEQDLGVLSMQRGVAELLDASGSVQLEPVAAEAHARRGELPRR